MASIFNRSSSADQIANSLVKVAHSTGLHLEGDGNLGFFLLCFSRLLIFFTGSLLSK